MGHEHGYEYEITGMRYARRVYDKHERNVSADHPSTRDQGCVQMSQDTSSLPGPVLLIAGEA